MLEMIVVAGILAAVAVMTARSFYRTVTGRNDGCGCSGGCRSCACRDFPVKGDPGEPPAAGGPGRSGEQDRATAQIRPDVFQVKQVPDQGGNR